MNYEEAKAYVISELIRLRDSVMLTNEKFEEIKKLSKEKLRTQEDLKKVTEKTKDKPRLNREYTVTLKEIGIMCAFANQLAKAERGEFSKESVATSIEKHKNSPRVAAFSGHEDHTGHLFVKDEQELNDALRLLDHEVERSPATSSPAAGAASGADKTTPERTSLSGSTPAAGDPTPALRSVTPTPPGLYLDYRYKKRCTKNLIILYSRK